MEDGRVGRGTAAGRREGKCPNLEREGVRGRGRGRTLELTELADSTLRRFSDAMSYTVICAFSARSATARYLRFALSATHVMPPTSAEPWMNRCVLVSMWCRMIWWPAGYSTVDSST